MTQILKFGFQGHSQAHSHVAINSFFSSLKHPSQPQHPLFPRHHPYQIEVVGCESLGRVFEMLQKQDVDFAMLPIENTHSGTFTQVYDLLLQYHNHVFIVGEYVVHEENSLLANTKLSLEQIERIYSHSHVLEQCSNIIADIRAKRVGKGLKPLQVYAMDDSAGAASFIAQEKVEKAAAIAHRTAAKTYGLEVIQNGVEDDVRSATRYLVLSSKPLTNEQLSFTSQMGTNKTSLAAIVKNAPGMLFKTLGAFAMRDLNITKMESRPSPRAYSSLTTHSPWEYINYIDIEGGLSDERVRNALANVNEYSNEVSVFGSYPRFSGVGTADNEGMGGAYGG